MRHVAAIFFSRYLKQRRSMYCCVRDNRDDVHDPKALKEEIINLKLQISRLRENYNSIDDRIDKHVDKWFEDNNVEHEVVGIKIFGLRVNIFPKDFERNIYKKILKIVYSFFKS